MRAFLGLLIAAFCLGSALLASDAARSNSYTPQQIARGKYLVVDAGTCQDCHTPRNQKGEFLQNQWLAGAPVIFKPTVPIPNWADKSANIAGLPNWTDEQAVKFLMTGVAYNGLPARPPMPEYRFSRADAKAIVAYLRSLKPAAVAVRSAAGTTRNAAEKTNEQ